MIPHDGSWSEVYDMSFNKMLVPSIVYFFVADCPHNTHGRVKTMPKIEFEFDLQNTFGDDHSPFTYEE